MLPRQPTRQFALNIVGAVREGCGPALSAALDRIGEETLRSMQGGPRGELIDFGAVPGIHYARWVVIPGPGDPYQNPAGDSVLRGPDALALSVWYDGPEEHPCASEARARESVVRALVGKGRPAFDLLYEHCQGYPVEGSDNQVVEYLLDRYIPAAALYFGGPGRSVSQILVEVDLARQVRAIVDDLRAAGPLPSASRVRSHVLRRLGAEPPRFPRQVRSWGPLVAKALALLPLVPPLVLVGLPWLLVLEGTDRQFDPVYSPAERAHVEETTRSEDIFFQNALSNVVEVKAGLFRRLLLRVVLFAVNALARDYCVNGTLGEIPSIHAAHWYLLDAGRRLAFVSNYDSSWESYLGDFIDRASSGLTAVWSNTSGYPRTRLLAFAGAQAGDRFLAWSRHIQIRTRVWYSAYPSLSIVQINDATLIRRGLADPHDVPPDEWLERLT